MSLSHATQSGRHPHAERGHDLYESPQLATEALLRIEQLPRVIWEPAAGRAIVDVLRDAGHIVIASDIIDRGADINFIADFLTLTKAPAGVEAVVSNPPFTLATKFVAHALELVPCVVMLLRLAFIESERRAHILDHGRLARVHAFQEAPANDAPRRLARPSCFERDRLRLVRVAARPCRADHNRSHLKSFEI